MFEAAKGFIKDYLLFVVEEIGETLPTKAAISKFRDIILNTGQSESQAFVQEAIGVKKKIHLPKLEFRQFSGNVEDWLPFWSQFEHIHKDADIALENKLHYLVKATVSGSRAREVIESFPQTGAICEKEVESLKVFGKQDLLVEVCVRELLKLIISVQKNENFSMTSLYDKLESYLRVLETLGVTTDKCASILHPMVESCFPEEFLRAWNRCPSSSSSVDAKERLTNLMNFFKTDVEGEESINLAMAGFGLNEKSSTQTLKKKQWHNGRKKISTATNFLTTSAKTSKQSCVFCKGTHSTANSFSAQKMSLADRLNILKEKNCCFTCLNVGPSIRKCRIFLKYVLCGKKHAPLMCEAVESRKHESKKPEEKEAANEINMSNISLGPKVFLQTLKVKMISDKKEVSVRIILDSGSQRSCSLKSLAEEMGYIPVRKETLVHSLFGGVKSQKFEHVTRLY
ncbi:hypothetical protein AVEN_171048-1 [Araneus ventricosus]|uniref:Peptidase aspartic putative domain-containing protein n=1 Tax=Araneus ventricosus TaxID=182803 RepID=A0A4Y2N473_ARAVE|nr:hypothetical protein AVEN_171048-1 [Araneus ventricosus]